MKTILCYGDSNTYGYDPRNGGRYPKELRWVTLLSESLGSDYEVISEGLNGRTTAYDRPDAVWKNGLPYLLPCFGTHKPVDTILFMLGTNDCNADLHLTAEDIAAGMEKLIITVKENAMDIQGFEPEMIIIVPAPMRHELSGTALEWQLDQYSVEKSYAIAPLYSALAEKYGCGFLDTTGKIEVTPIDCEHLTIEGHRQLAAMIEPLVR